MFIVSCGAKRSGSTLSYLLTSKLIEQSGLGSYEGYFETLSMKKMSSIAGFQKKDWLSLIKTHDVEGALALRGYNIKFIYTLREPKEMVISGLKKFSWTEIQAKQFLKKFAVEAARISSDERALILDYSDLVDDPKSQLKIIADFIGIAVTPEQLSGICNSAKKPEALGRFSQKVVGTKRSMLRLAQRLKLKEVARSFGLSQRLIKSVVYFLNSVDPSTLIHADHNTSEILVDKKIEEIVGALSMEISAAQKIHIENKPRLSDQN